MAREQKERRPSKPGLPRVEPGDAERLATRFNAIHTRWQGESPSKPPASSSATPQHEANVDRSGVIVSPILKIDGATPPMSSALNLAQDVEPHPSAPEPEPWEHEEGPFAQASADRALNEPDATAAPTADAEGDDRLSPTPRVRTRAPDKGAADTRSDVGGRREVPASFGAEVEQPLEHEGTALAGLRPPGRWRWLLAALTLAVAGVSLYRTLYVVKSPSQGTAASVMSAAAPPPSPAPPLPEAAASASSLPEPAPAAAAPVAATPTKARAAPRLAEDSRQVKASAAPSPPAKSKTRAPKPAVAAPVAKTAAGVKASSGGTKPSAKQAAASGRRKLSAKPRKPPQKKERTGIIRKSPF